jgi:hypothetical protein
MCFAERRIASLMKSPDNEESTAEATLSRASQALLLTRIVASVLATAWFAAGEAAAFASARFGAMYAEFGSDMLPFLTGVLIRYWSLAAGALALLFAATLFFIWSGGRRAAWMAGIGLLLLTLFVPAAVWAIWSPVFRIMTEMGNM